MDPLFLFLILIAVALGAVAIRNGRNSDLFTFPFLFPAVTVAFVLVEFSDFMLNAGVLYDIYRDTGAVTVALFMIASCALLGLLGHSLGSRGAKKMPTAPKDLQPPAERDIRYMHYAAIAVGAMSFVAFVALANLAGGLQEYIFNAGNYAIEFRGLPVYLIFVVRLIYVSIVIELWLWVRTKRTRHLRWALLFAIIPAINIFFIFRRAEVIKLGVFFGYFLTNYRYVSIGRTPALLGMVVMYGVLRIFPVLRTEAGQELEFDELVGRAMERDSYQASEIGSGLLRIYQTMEAATYEYGAIFYNAVIKQFVPAGLIGAEAKSELMIKTMEYADTSFTTYRFYVSPMGFAQAYQQFWLLGGLIFLVLGYVMARFEKNRFYNRRQEILLVLLIPAAVSTVSTDLRFLLPQLITYTVVTMLCVPKGDRNEKVIGNARPSLAR